jgi:hypothetical protein
MAMRQQLLVGLVGISAALGAAACGPSPDYFEEVNEPNEAIQHYEPPPSPIAPNRSTDDPPAARGSLVGKWTGVGHQSNGPTWEMELDIARLDEGPCAVVRYPECAGYWSCMGTSDGNRIEAVERITDGRGRCTDRVEVEASLAQDGNAVVFRARAGDVTADARLTPPR